MSIKVTTVLESYYPTLLNRILGGIAILSFVCSLIASVVSPLIVAWAVVHECYLFESVVIVVSVIAYLPWPPRQKPSTFQRFMRRYQPCYFDKTTVLLEGTKLPHSNEPQTLYAVHSHGALAIRWGILYCHPLFQHVRFCFAAALYISPLFRLYSRCAGNPGNAAKPAIITYMKQHHECLSLISGGFEEATLTSFHVDRVIIRKRTGFIRLCLQHGIRIRPVFVFGEKSCYWNIQGQFPMRLALNRYFIPAILPWGHWLVPLLPKPHCQIYIVVGSPLVLPHIVDPTPQQVHEWHEKYVSALIRLYEEHKEAAYGTEIGKCVKLEIW
jgi:2-acylglycerol O-acyltransferase 2